MMDKKMCAVHKTSWVLVLVGALNWGLIGLFELDLVAWLLGGADSLLSRIVYVLVGVAALAILGKHKCKMCVGGGEKKEGTEKRPGSSMGGEGGDIPQ